MSVTVIRSIGELAAIAARSPGYAVEVVEAGKCYQLTDIHFRTHNGRKNRGVVECLSNGESAAFASDEKMNVVD